ncbi:MAG: aminotransferase class V-fold PLP-dependent enzyme [Salibacteraceae bacterium]|nr:aminotransferase class V-fold PLP-dependent enzyme [Salibacteraceae bacterium]MDP4686091.1 aminotransferase class V-fold PLP-dependent enzyme [Salibacteraceae bacterium]MDP4764586.1 aminotransferase class V-fold PLP-dependent enzyme [Salibacteraceae bacterium]
MQNQKHLVFLDEDIHYLNCAAKSPLLLASEKAMQDALNREKQIHLRTANDFFDRLEIARGLFSKLINCNSAQVAFMPAVSYGFSSVLKNIPATQGEHIVVIESEFPSDYLAVERWCSNFQKTIKTIAATDADQSADDWNARILASINKETAAVVMSAIHWITGYKFDLEAIGARCREMEAIFVVDGTQAAGAMHIDVEAANIDALICAGYKWLFGPYSLGCFYMSERFNKGIPIEESWMNRTNSTKFSELTNYGETYTPGAGRYSVGETSNFLLMPLLIEGLKQVNDWNPAAIQAYCQDLAKPLHTFMDFNGLSHGASNLFASHLFSLKLPENISSDVFSQTLADRKIYASARGSGVRVSFNVFNTKEDLDALIDALKS